MNELQAVTAATEPPVARQLHAVGRARGIPIAGTFELTAGCNFNCRNCYVHDAGVHATRENELTAAQWLHIGEQAANAGTVFLLLTGGEPLLRPDFEEIYTGLKKLGLMVSVNTNGSLLTGKTAALFERNPPVRLNVSLYGDSPETYTRVCGVNAYDTVLANIKRMKEAGVEVKLNVLLTPGNADGYQRLAEQIGALGLHCQASAYAYPPVRRSAPADAERLAPQEAAKLRVRWDLLRGKYASAKNAAERIALPETRTCDEGGPAEEGVRCRAGHTSYWITAAGDVLICGMIHLPCGNAAETDFTTCWQAARALMKTIRMPKQCTACSLRPVCCVCPAACFAETGGFTEAPPYLCEMSRAIVKELAQIREEGPELEA